MNKIVNECIHQLLEDQIRFDWNSVFHESGEYGTKSGENGSKLG